MASIIVFIILVICVGIAVRYLYHGGKNNIYIAPFTVPVCESVFFPLRICPVEIDGKSADVRAGELVFLNTVRQIKSFQL